MQDARLARFSLAALLIVLLTALTLGCRSLGSGATKQEPTSAEAISAKKLHDLGLSMGRAYELLRSLVTEAPQRLSGSEGADRAVEWAEATMKKIGLSNVRLEPCTVPHWERGEIEEVELIQPGPPRPLPALALGGSIGTPREGLQAEVVVVRSPIELDQLGESIRGKIVLFNRPMPRALRNTFQAYRSAVPQRTGGAVEAAKRGAIATLVRSMTTRQDDVPHTGAMRYAEGVPKIPAVAISTRAADRLASLAREGKRIEVRIRLSCKTHEPKESANVVGEIVGRSKAKDVVVIGGHLDSWDVGQGAHDDGSGIVHCLEAVRLLRALGARPKRTIRVVCFMNEENGLAGARAYARAHADEPHHAAIESDRGGFEPKGFTTSARGARFERYKQYVRELSAFDMGRCIPGGGGADIAPLGERGVPLFGLLPAWHRYFDYHHSERDTIDAVHPRELQLGAVAVAWLAWRLANE